MLESKDLKAQFEAELQERLKKMEKELENSLVKATGKHCCKTMNHLLLSFLQSMNSKQSQI